MSTTVSPNLMKELKSFGLKDAGNCYHCGNCTGVCPLSTEDNPFPRKMVRMAQLGLKDKLMNAPEPWLCYYCGECSDRCPRGADPGETMMVIRRFQTANFDWTGFARRFYTSEVFELTMIGLVAAVVGLAFIFFANWSASTPTTFAPPWVIEILDLLMAAGLTFFLLSNVWRCVKIVMGDQLKVIPKDYYINKIKDLIINFAIQRPFNKCDDRTQWWVHLLIMTGYSSVFIMVVMGLRWFQRDQVIDPSYPMISYVMTIVGMYSTFAILYGTGYAMIGRIKKSKAPYKNSHPTDWMFLILLQLTTLTGFLMFVFNFLQIHKAYFVTYMIHLMVAVPMLTLEVPFAKWSHLAYRPVVLFLSDVKNAYAKDLKEHPEKFVEDEEEAPTAKAA